MPAPLVALVAAPDGRVAVVDDGLGDCLPPEQAVARAEALVASGARLVWWSAASDARVLVAARVPVARCWDVAEAHRLLAGGWEAGPPRAWATAQGLDLASVPAPSRGDLFDFHAADDTSPDAVVRADGYLAAGAGTADWHP